MIVIARRRPERTRRLFVAQSKDAGTERSRGKQSPNRAEIASPPTVARNDTKLRTSFLSYLSGKLIEISIKSSVPVFAYACASPGKTRTIEPGLAGDSASFTRTLPLPLRK
jgi:hypothetical protein